MKKLSARTEGFTDSVIRRMTRVCNQYGAVNLSQGFPDFEPPAAILDRLQQLQTVFRGESQPAHAAVDLDVDHQRVPGTAQDLLIQRDLFRVEEDTAYLQDRGFDHIFRRDHSQDQDRFGKTGIAQFPRFREAGNCQEDRSGLYGGPRNRKHTVTVCVRFQDSRDRKSGNVPDQFQIVFNGLKIDLQPGFISFICHTLYFTLKKVIGRELFEVR